MQTQEEAPVCETGEPRMRTAAIVIAFTLGASAVCNVYADITISSDASISSNVTTRIESNTSTGEMSSQNASSISIVTIGGITSSSINSTSGTASCSAQTNGSSCQV